MDFSFTGEVIEWRGPAPFYFIETPAKCAPEIKAIAADKSYGWGVLHAMVTIKNQTFKTALFPKQGTYLVPLKNAVRLPLEVAVGDKVKVELDFDF
ncbi:MAG: DUF1905 domain-containing protein [Candidatus Planktophila sp.]|nr:DUF1905 domain-containing protein [Candidatus Planktophila sp.]